MTETQFVDVTQLEFTSEPVESEDFTQEDRFLIKPRTYISPSRKLSGTPKYKMDERGEHVLDGNGNKIQESLTFRVEFTDGITDGNGTSHRYVPSTWLSTKTFSPRNGTGKTSSVAEYLRQFGYNPSRMNPREIQDALKASENLPVGVRMGLEDDSRDREKVMRNGRLVPGKRRAYTRDFNIGTKEEPIWAATITKDGVQMSARPVVEGFKRIV